jgi:D-amino-acid dehydrogenase
VKVAVIGGGVVGLGTAYELARAGAEVTLVERDRLGAGASSGNTGWVTPALCAVPVPGPGVVGQALKWMLRPDSPFLLRPRLDPGFAAWLWRFRSACAPARFSAGLQALVAHNRGAVGALLDWQAQGVEFESYREGTIFAALTEAALRNEHELYARLQAEGFPVEVELLSGDEAREREPALSDRVVAGLFSHGEWHVRPESLTAGLADAVRRCGCEVREGVTVTRLEREREGWRLATTSGEIDAERVVVTASVWSSDLLRPLGYRLPLEAAKGYSITATGEGTRPSHAVYLLEAKVACSPFADGVRLAGTLELAGRDLALNRTRVRAIERAAETYLRWRPVGPDLEWAGLRPLAPDGLPVIGAVPGCQGLFVSTGHGMAGITLAAVSAQLLSPLVLNGIEPRELAGLSPARFA